MKTISHASMVEVYGYKTVISNTVKRVRMMIAGMEMDAVRQNKKIGNSLAGGPVDDSDIEPASVPAYDEHGRQIIRNNGSPKMELDFDADALTWEQIFDVFSAIKQSKKDLMAKYSMHPVGEPERDRAAFLNRVKRFEHLIWEDADFAGDDLPEDMEEISRRVEWKRRGITGDMSQKTPGKKRGAPESKAGTQSAKRPNVKTRASAAKAASDAAKVSLDW